MRRGWTTGLVLVLLSACTRPNPAFEELTDGDPATTAVTSSLEGAEGSSSPASTGGDTTRGMSGPDDGSATRGDSGSDSPLDSGPGGPGCMLDFRDSYGFESVPTLEELFRGCPEETMTLRILGSNQGDHTHFMGNRCPPDECSCLDEFPISLMFEVPLVQADGCFDLVFQLEPGSCEVLAYALVPPSGGLPLMIVSNVVTPAFESTMNVGLGERQSGEECNESCERPPGHYSLAVGDGMIPPNGLPEPLMPYTFVNDGSGIDEDCEEVGRWHARQGPL